MCIANAVECELHSDEVGAKRRTHYTAVYCIVRNAEAAAGLKLNCDKQLANCTDLWCRNGKVIIVLHSSNRIFNLCSEQKFNLLSIGCYLQPVPRCRLFTVTADY